MRTTLQPYTKPPLTWDEQLNLLAQRGMVIDNPDRARVAVAHSNYYRLAAYWLPFEADHATHRFQAGVKLDQVVNLYDFDRKLRLLMLEGFECIEVSVRSQFAYHFSHAHGAHAHLQSQFAKNSQHWANNVAKWREEVERSDETFIRHLRSKYPEALPPLWAACEVMSFGLLSRWYNNLAAMTVRTAIARTYQLDEATLGSWLHHLTLVRNVCAHHGRLWNREFTVTPMAPRHKPPGLAAQWAHGSRRLYNAISLVAYMQQVARPGSDWTARIVQCLTQHDVTPADLGFPAGWQSFELWRGP